MIQISFTLNGRKRTEYVEKRWTLMKFLREHMMLTGTKCGCGTGDCGACKVLLDGSSVTSCNLPAYKIDNREVVTIEGFENPDGTLHPIQQAFIEEGAIQCGFCTPGMIIETASLLKKIPKPSEEDIRNALEKNICRCTGYVKIVKAVQKAASLI